MAAALSALEGAFELGKRAVRDYNIVAPRIKRMYKDLRGSGARKAPGRRLSNNRRRPARGLRRRPASAPAARRRRARTRRNYQNMVCVGKSGAAFRSKKTHKRFEHKVRCVLSSTPKEQIVVDATDSYILGITGADPSTMLYPNNTTGVYNGNELTFSGYSAANRVMKGFALIEGSGLDEREGQSIQVKRIQIKQNISLQQGVHLKNVSAPSAPTSFTDRAQVGQHLIWHTVVIQYKPNADMTAPASISAFILAEQYKYNHQLASNFIFRGMVNTVTPAQLDAASRASRDDASHYKVIFRKKRKITYDVHNEPGIDAGATDMMMVQFGSSRQFTDTISFTPQYHILYDDSNNVIQGEMVIMNFAVPCGWGLFTHSGGTGDNGGCGVKRLDHSAKIHWMDLQV